MSPFPSLVRSGRPFVRGMPDYRSLPAPPADRFERQSPSGREHHRDIKNPHKARARLPAAASHGAAV
jgi:hypothetical protein